MAQFKVYALPAQGGLILDLQSDYIDLVTRVVARLIPVEDSPPILPRLKPVFRIGDTDYVLHMAEIAAVPAALCSGPPVADLSAEDYAIRGALDMLFSGF